jgi:hypothetical protein
LLIGIGLFSFATPPRRMAALDPAPARVGSVP